MNDVLQYAFGYGTREPAEYQDVVTFVLIHIILYYTFKTFLLSTTDAVSCIENLRITFIKL